MGSELPPSLPVSLTVPVQPSTTRVLTARRWVNVPLSLCIEFRARLPEGARWWSPREENSERCRAIATKRHGPLRFNAAARIERFFVSSAYSLQTPLRHIPAQGTPQSPQFCSSIFTFVHAASPPPAGVHDLKLPGQAQAPSEQIWPLSHVMPQPPQFLRLASVLTQTAGSPHSSVGPAQTHMPASQVRPPVQAMPQPPQLSMSVSVTTQAPAHSVSFAAQSARQAPCEQTSPLAQAVAQSPQCAGSVVMSTQTPPHSSPPFGQPQTPCVQL